jgi:hypothetical protein
MLPSSESATELSRLRERVYGAGAEATADEIARLRELEAGPTAAAPPEELHSPAEEESVGADDAAAPSSDVQPAAVSGPRSRWRTVLIAAAAAAAAAVLAFAAGVAVATPPAAEEFPELLRPQTEDDVFPVATDDVLAAAVDLTSARFIARLDGFDVFLARPAGGPGLCLLTRDAGSFALLNGACSGEDGASSSVGLSATPGLEIVAGDLGERAGVPIELSESVTAYRQ